LLFTGKGAGARQSKSTVRSACGFGAGALPVETLDEDMPLGKRIRPLCTICSDDPSIVASGGAGVDASAAK